MTPQLRERIIWIRQELAKADPTIGFLAPPSLRQSFPQEVPLSYQSFLREVDGAACGIVMLYESEEILLQQADAIPLPGGRARWFCFGMAQDYPLVIDRQNENVHLVPLEGHFDEANALGELDYFLLTSVFGSEYSDFLTTPDDDGWFDLVSHPAIS